ncbi:MAG: DUF4388 domain-containing protein [Fibrobacter sp.]|nr:DUF4388 domain-containing protein [Fibrobacter sp.]
MVLSGTLREFILADVFQLLTQQKITGKLILNNGRSEGFVIFQNGLVVAAQKDDEKFLSKLYNYLISVKKHSSSKIRALFAAFEGDISGLTNEITVMGLIPKHDLNMLAESTTMDIACSLFLWKTGTYRFNSITNVDSLVPAEISIPVENIVMEAMRRVDEWNRMLQCISEQSIFVRNQKNANDLMQEIDPLSDPDSYILMRINGTSPVKDLLSSLCLSEYKIYESLYNLLQNKRITFLSDRISQSVQAALHKKEREHSTSRFYTLYSILTALGIILLILFMALVVFKKVIVPDRATDAHHSRIELPSALAKEKASIAKIYYRAKYSTEPQSPEELKEFKLLSDRDFFHYLINSDSEQKK